MLDNKELHNIQKINKANEQDALTYYKRYRRQIFIRRISEGLMITLFSYIGLYLGPLDHLWVPVWPHTGVLLGLFFLRGPRILGAALLGTLLACINQYTLMDALILTALHSGSPYIAYEILKKSLGPITPFSRLKVAMKACPCLIAFGSLFGALTVITTSSITPSPEQYAAGMMSWTLGLIVFTPLCWIWDTYIPKSNNKYPWVAISFLGIFIALNAFYCFSVDPFLVFVGFSICCIVLILSAVFFSQLVSAITAVIQALFFLSWIDLPGGKSFLVYPEAIVLFQCIFLITMIVTHLYAAHKKEKRMMNAVKAFFNI